MLLYVADQIKYNKWDCVQVVMVEGEGRRMSVPFLKGTQALDLHKNVMIISFFLL